MAAGFMKMVTELRCMLDREATLRTQVKDILGTSNGSNPLEIEDREVLRNLSRDPVLFGGRGNADRCCRKNSDDA